MTDAVQPDNNGNGKVTLAVLGTKLDNVMARVEEVRNHVNRNAELTEARIRCLENGQVERQTQIKNIDINITGLQKQVGELDKCIDDLRFKDKVWGGVAGLVGAVSGILSGLFGGK